MYRPTILLVDDQLSSLLAIEHILEDIDARILKATSAREAMIIMMKEKVDCILLDVSMPGMDGFEFLRTLHNAPAHTKIPVIMVTGKVFSENENLKAYQYGAVDYLLKPLDSEIVYRKVSFIVHQAIRLKAIDGIVSFMEGFDRQVVTPLKQVRRLMDTHPLKDTELQSEDTELQVALCQERKDQLDLAIKNIDELSALWEGFYESRKAF